MKVLFPLLLLGVWLTPAAAAGELILQAVDRFSEPVWARFEVHGEDGKMHQPPFALRDRTARNRAGEAWYLGSFVAREPAHVKLEPGKYRVVVERGTEFQRIEQQVEISGDEPLELTVTPERWIDMNQRGWYSADFHVHRTIGDAPALTLAEDLNLAVVFTMWNKRDVWEGKPYPKNAVREIDKRHVLTVLNAEDERGGGAWMLHGLRQKLKLGVPGRWYPVGLDFIEQAKAQRYVPTGFPWVDLEKPFWLEAPVVMALSRPDSIGLLHNHFNIYGMNPNEAWGRARDEEKYPGFDGFARNSLEINYRFWNLGFRTPASAGSASGVLPNPVGYNRVYVQLDEPFGVEPFYRQLRQGRSFVTNGPMLFFEAAQAPSGDIRVTIQAESRDPLERVELLANGVVIQTFAAPPGERKFSAEVEVPAGIYSWIAARAFEENEYTIRMAHSQPYWTGGEWIARDDAAYFSKWIEDLIAETESDEERFENDEQRAAVIEVYRRALAVYQKMQ